MDIYKNAKIVDPDEGRVYNGEVAVSDGQVVEVSEKRIDTPENCLVIDCKGKYLAPGIVDFGVKIGEPGERHKESFGTAGLAAARGGVTAMISRPDTSPPIDNPETLEFFIRRAKSATEIPIHPLATLTKQRLGEQMTEVSLLLDAGAVGFTDCDSFISNSKVMANCLSYCSQNNSLVIGHPQDPWLSGGTSATSGKFATLRGLAGVSPMAERIGLERDLALVEMTGSNYHADQITTREGLMVMEQSLDKGLNVSAGISIHHLTLNDLDVGDYRTFFKVKPPLRSEDDRQSAIDGLKRGVITIVCSMHTPQDEESKRIPFDKASSGAVGLETLFPALLRLYHSGDLDLPLIFKVLSYNPSKRFGLNSGRISKGYQADFVLFDPDYPYILDRTTLASKSKNTPFDGQSLQGKILKTVVAGRIVYSREEDV